MASVNLTSVALTVLAPGALWSIQNEDYDTLVWNSPDIQKPSKQDVLAKAAELDTILTYQAKRRQEYPILADQLDAIWKGGDAEVAMREQILAVKAKYPKPEGV